MASVAAEKTSLHNSTNCLRASLHIRRETYRLNHFFSFVRAMRETTASPR